MPGSLHESDVDGWHPTVRRIHDYWCSIHPQIGLPGRQHIDPLEIPTDLLPNIWLLDIQQEPLRAKYRLVGTGIVRAIGHDFTGHWLDETDTYAPAQYLVAQATIRKVVESHRLVWSKGSSSLQGQHDHQEAEVIRLPLASDGATVDVILNYAIFYNVDGSRRY